ncbi:response regulator [Desulfonatronovibrio magnus]|uniref:response regulator n=1 Tax=Desulfonatronovibrio magnus TaxID=698827 RepID=UPI000696FB5E|nr:response regulator [Desulfonatronovibrio magnus]
MKCMPRTGNIMLVDDTPGNLKLLMDLLRDRGYKVLAFLNGPDALAAAEDNPPDLILLDIVMPKMDGYEVCRQLKSNDKLKDIPVLFISALSEPQDKVRAFAVGGADYVSKPIQPEEVDARVETHLRLSRLLHQSQECNRVLIEELPDVVMRFDSNARHQFVSSGISEISDLDAAQYIGKTHRELGFSEAMCMFWEGVISRVFATGERVEREMLLGSESKPVFHDLRLFPEKNARGEIQSVLAISRDITAQKKAELEMLKAKQKAEAASLAKSQFLNNMSHEIRTPLNGITGIMEIMSTWEMNPDQKEMIDLGNISAKRLASLFSDILDLSTIESGKMAIRSKHFCPKELTSIVNDLFMLSVKEKGIEYECHVDPDLPETLIGDKTRVQQVLFNLVGNAIKFTSRGKVELSVTTLSQLEPDKCRVLFSVVDNGPGIAGEKLDELFEPFVQADGSYSRRHEGAGLGLGLVRRLVEMMDGNISVESEEGYGTAVHVALTFQTSHASREDDTIDADAYTGQTSLKILLAEDEPVNQKIISKMLETMGHKIVLANDGLQAVQLIMDNDFDLVLMDVQMPVMDGLEATAAVRESQELGAKSNIPIIAVTAHALPGDKESFLKAGMNDYLAKPVNIEEFKRVFRKYCGVQ